MGYLFLSIALFSGMLKGYCGKRLGGYADNIKSAVLLNLIRMLLCVVFGLGLLLINGEITYCEPTPGLLFVCALSGISTAFFVVVWLLAVRKSAYMMLDVFLMVGTVIPMVMGCVFFAEPVRGRQWLGFWALVLAAFIMCSYHNSVKTKLTPASFVLLIACGAANGIADFSQKLYVKSFPELPVSVFNFYTYVFAAITLAFVQILFRREETAFNHRSVCVSVLYVIAMAAALAANSYFKTMAACYLDSAQLYPLNQGAGLVFSSLMATFLFKEKFTKKACAGIVLAFVALMIMNV